MPLYNRAAKCKCVHILITFCDMNVKQCIDVSSCPSVIDIVRLDPNNNWSIWRGIDMLDTISEYYTSAMLDVLVEVKGEEN